MSSFVFNPESFKTLPKDGARFEALVCQLLELMGYRILERPAVGTEGGRDVLLERSIKDAMNERSERVVVQCKHYAHSGKAVGDIDVGVWRNAMARYKARGYLLVTDTRVTENLSRSFREFTNDEMNYPNWASFWDVDDLISHLNQHPTLRNSFFYTPEAATTPLNDLASEISSWLLATRYQISGPKEVSNDIVEIIATLDEGSINQRVLLWCIAGEATSMHIDSVNKKLTRETPYGWIISDKRVSRQAKQRAAESGNCKVFTLSDFLTEMIWGKYFLSLRKQVEQDEIPKLYVNLGCYKLETDDEGNVISQENYQDVAEYIDGWLTERGKSHISILGPFGSGKTWFCRYYAFRQLERFLKDPVRERLPLLITLRMFTKALTSQQLINDALIEQYKLPFIGSAYDVFKEMNRRGKLLLILDGFDEMARQVDYQTVVDNFWELSKLVKPLSKVILTSRTEYFRWAKESEKIFEGKEEGRNKIILEPPKFEVVYVESFDNEQIQAVITKRAGEEKGQGLAQKVLDEEVLTEMARKPILIELLLAALDDVNTDVLSNLSSVYLYATNKLLLRNISADKTFTSTTDKLFFLCELAWEMVKTGEFRIHYSEIPERIRTYFGEVIKDKHQLDIWDYDLRNQTLLHRDAAGYYAFAHRSLAEYFVAFKFATELGALSSKFQSAYTEINGAACVLPIQNKSFSDLTYTLGAFPLVDERMLPINQFLLGMLDSTVSKRLFEILDETKGKDSDYVQFLGSNALSLLSQTGETLANQDLSRRSLNRSFLIRADLRGSDLSESDLTGAWLSHTYLAGANLRNALLIEINLETISGVKSIAVNPISGVVLSGSSDGNLELWDISEGHKLHEFLIDEREQLIAPNAITGVTRHRPADLLGGGVKAVTFSPDGHLLAGASDTGVIGLWDATTYSLHKRLKTQEEITDICFSPDGRTIASTDWISGDITVRNTNDLGFVRRLDAQENNVGYDLRYSPNGQYLAAANVMSGISVWDIRTGTLITILTVEPTKVESLCFTSDGKYIVVADYSSRITIWSVGSWKKIATLPEADMVPSIANSPIDNRIVTGMHNGFVSIWDMDTFKRKTHFQAHEGSVYAVCFSSDGKYIVTGGLDARIHVFNSYSGECMRTMNQKLRYVNLDVRGATGLRQHILYLFALRGAILDDEQKKEATRETDD